MDYVDEDIVDIHNFIGIYFSTKENNKYFDETSGAHFEYTDLCNRLKRLLPIHSIAISKGKQDCGIYNQHALKMPQVISKDFAQNKQPMSHKSQILRLQNITSCPNKKYSIPILHLETVRKSVQLLTKMPSKKKQHLNKFNFKSFDLRDSSTKNVLSPLKASLFSPIFHRTNFFNQETGTLSRIKQKNAIEHLSSIKNTKYKV